MATMAERGDDEVWYASYGSNCLAARFATYLTGGRPEGADRGERGARDPRPPRASASYWFDADVRFLGDAPKWGGGGIAFLDHGRGGPTPGRRYLITRGQFEDLAAQESRRATVELPLDDLEVGVVHPLGPGRYDGLLALPPVDGTPVITFTSPQPEVALATNPPSAAYLSTIVRGLIEVHDTPLAELVACLHRSPGVATGWSPGEIAALAGNEPIDS